MATFEEQFKSEQDCRTFLKKLKYPDGSFCCPACGDTGCTQLASRDLSQCNFCKKQYSLTAGTIFHGARTPLLKLFRISWDVCVGITRSASRLAKELDLPYSTTWEWLHKLRSAMQPIISHEQFVELDSSYLQDLLFRRSRESPARKTDEVDYESMKTHPPGASTVEQQSDSHDEPGDLTASASCAMRAFLRKTFHGISRKYAQRYAVQLGFALLRSHKPLTALAAVVRYGPIPRWTIGMYSSPETISLPLRAIREDTCIKLWRQGTSG
jgi:Transposase zinc-ribbon domain